ncbi:MAG: putative bifunctional diguanylate cyclase/phosphodiesterase [Gaiella sp.]
MRRLVLFLACALAGLAPYVVLRAEPGSARYHGWLALVGVLAAGAVVAGLRLNRQAGQRSWQAIAAALCLLAAAHGYDAVAVVNGLGATYPGVPEYLRFLAVPCFGYALFAFVRHRTPARDWGAILDAAIVATGAASATWVLVVQPFAGDVKLEASTRIAAGALPLVGVAVFGLVLRLAVVSELDLTAITFISVATITQMVADSFAATAAVGGFVLPAQGVDLLRAVAILLWGAAALSPSMRDLSQFVERPDSWPIRRRIVLLGAAVLLTATMVVLQSLRDETGLSRGTVAVAVALLLLVSARLATLVVAFERSVNREHVLQAGAAALVSARTRQEIGAVAAETALELAGGSRQAFVELEMAQRPEITAENAVVVGDGEIASAVRGDLRKAGGLGRMGTARTFLVPIVVRSTLHGLLRVTGLRPVAWHLHQGLDTLASQVSLALEAAEREQDLVERRSDERFRTLVQNSKDLIAVIEADLEIRYVTPSVEAMLGYAPDDLIGTSLAELLHVDEAPALIQRFRDEVRQIGSVGAEFRLRHADHTWRAVEGVMSDLTDDPSVLGIVLTAHDITDRRRLEERLTHQAFHDALTGLPNRALLADRLAHAIERAKRTGADVAVLFLDVDDFKTINDSLGHAAGDELLVELATRLQGCLRSADTAARLGGDEFALLLEDSLGVDGATVVADRVLEAIAQPMLLGSSEVLPRASVGIVFAAPGQTAGELLRNADVAMYQAKQSGGHRYELFQPEMHEAALTRLELKADLERAFHGNELDLHYQPLVQLQDGQTTGFEALLRWQHPVRGYVPPSEFVPLAEETGLINDIGRWVIRRACQQTRAWQLTVPGYPTLSANVNLSAKQILQPYFKEDVASALSSAGLAPTDLVLEITESTLMEDVEGVSLRLAELRAMGVRIAIDDFGTGFSSLGYLQRFPVDELKIAREFVDEVVRDPRRARLVEAIIALARSLDLNTIAEGIEEPAQRDRLLALGCTIGQGYLFSRPVPAAEVPNLLRAVIVDAA